MECKAIYHFQLLLQSEGGGQSVELPGRAENLRNCSCCCHGIVLYQGGYIISVPR